MNRFKQGEGSSPLPGAAYIRFSSEMQSDSFSLDAQLRQIKEQAERDGARQDDHHPGGDRSTGRISFPDLIPTNPGSYGEPEDGRSHLSERVRPARRAPFECFPAGEDQVQDRYPNQRPVRHRKADPKQAARRDHRHTQEPTQFMRPQ